MSIKEGIERIARVERVSRIYRYNDSRSDEQLFPGRKQAELKSFGMIMSAYEHNNTSIDHSNQVLKSSSYSKTAQEVEQQILGKFDVRC